MDTDNLRLPQSLLKLLLPGRVLLGVLKRKYQRPARALSACFKRVVLRITYRPHQPHLSASANVRHRHFMRVFAYCPKQKEVNGRRNPTIYCCMVRQLYRFDTQTLFLHWG